MDILTLIPILALINERLTEFLFGQPFDKIPALTPYKWALIYIAAIMGVLVAATYHIDLWATITGAPPTPLGIALTGLFAIGGGSSIAHDIIQAISNPK